MISVCISKNIPAKPIRLSNSGGLWFYRSRIPKELSSGKFFTLSLRTADRKIALDRLQRIAVRFRSAGLITLEGNDMNQFKMRLKELAEEVLETGLQRKEVVEDVIKSTQSYIRYADTREARTEYQARLEVCEAHLEAINAGSLRPLEALTNPAPAPESTPPQSIPEPEPTKKPEAHLEALYDRLEAVQLRTGKWQKSVATSKRQYIGSLTKAMMTTWGNTNLYDRSLEDWEQLQLAYSDNDNAAGTINKYMSLCKNIVKYAGSKTVGHCEIDRLIALKDDGKGTAYLPEQTKEIVDLAKKGEIAPELEQAIVIAAFTGMRINEVVGLTASDYIQEDGKVVGIIVRNNERRTLKNSFSARVVPTPVWPEGWNPDVTLFENMADYNGDSSKFSTNYKRYIDRHLPHLGNDADGKRLVFHSHRHGAITRCWRVLPPETAEGIITPIMGHGYKSESGKTYRKAPDSLEDVQGLIEPCRLMNQAIL